ncbi:MAG TPA: peptidyl-prolyl cis-trans isomerase [Opitutaceae bacterium]|nr:peptidyl-prolyl cis-trans isomerase [Opitutaceae bacterium]
MISWIQRYFQHHFRTIFAVLLGLIIVSFVFTIGPSGLRKGDQRSVTRHFFNYNLTSTEGQQRLMGDASVSASLQLGNMSGIEGEQVQNYALQRAATLHLADQLHIPPATTSEITDFIKGLRAFMGQTGQFDPKAYETFRDSLKSNSRFTEADIRRVMGDDVRAQKVQRLLAGPGYVLPADVKQMLSRTETSWTLAIATADYASFAPEVKPADADLTKYYEENPFRYEIPPRVLASFVGFPATAFLDKVTVTDADVRSFYDVNPARFPKPADPKAPVPSIAPQDSSADFNAVRPQVEAALKLERAQRLALKAASDFVYSLYSGKVTRGPALDALLAQQKLAPVSLQPFTRNQGPAELGNSPEVAVAAFALDETRYYSDPLPNAGGAVVLLWQETQPSHKPLFVEVRAKVLADYVENEKTKRFVEMGRTLKAQLENRLKAGDTLEKAAAAVSSSSGVKLEAKTLAPFTEQNPPQDVDPSVFGTLQNLEKGRVSDMTLTQDKKGLLVYALDKKIPDLSEANLQYAAMRAQLASYNSRLGSRAMVSEIVEKELLKSSPKVQ